MNQVACRNSEKEDRRVMGFFKGAPRGTGIAVQGGAVRALPGGLFWW